MYRIIIIIIIIIVLFIFYNIKITTICEKDRLFADELHTFYKNTCSPNYASYSEILDKHENKSIKLARISTFEKFRDNKLLNINYIIQEF